MAYEHVPKEHVEHLLRMALDAKRINGKARTTWQDKLTSSDAGDHVEAIQFIEEALPGELERVADIWVFQGQRALHLWVLPFLEGRTVSDAVANHPSMKRKMDSGNWTNLQVPSDEGVHVKRVRVAADEISIQVWVTKAISFFFQEKQQVEHRTENVLVRIQFTYGARPIAEVYATQRDSRLALLAVLDWIRGSVTPRRQSKEQEKIFRPVTFTEAQIEQLATTLGWGTPSAVRGADPTNEVGELALSGHKKGFRTDCLDPKVNKVKQQLRATNLTRRYNVTFDHPDGFKEQPDASFYFQGGQSRIQFHTKTSRLAMRHVITNVRAQIGV
jgi:hypothetical protein